MKMYILGKKMEWWGKPYIDGEALYYLWDLVCQNDRHEIDDNVLQVNKNPWLKVHIKIKTQLKYTLKLKHN